MLSVGNPVDYALSVISVGNILSSSFRVDALCKL